MGIGLMPFMPPAESPPELAFLQSAEDTADQSSYSFTSHNFGAAASNREIIIAVIWKGSGAARTLNSATIGGVSADLRVAEVDGSQACRLIQANVPTGTSGTVALTFSGTCTMCKIGTYRAINLKDRAPHDTDSDTDQALAMSLNILKDGFAIGAAIDSDHTTGFSTTGLTEDFDDSVESADRAVAASASGMAAEMGRTITFDGGSSAIGAAAGVCASWR